MGKIYVFVEDVDVKLAPKDNAAAVGKAVKAGIVSALKADAATTPDTKGEGYTLAMRVAKLTVEGSDVDLKLSVRLTRFPNKKEMFTIGGSDYSAEAKASGAKPEAAIDDCVDGVLGTMMPKIIGAMKKGAR